MSAAKSFEIGLVMAGAISAGAYTAGVIDFLLEALDAWHAAKKRGDQVPDHGVRLRVMSGASAGGMTAAMTLAELRNRHDPVLADPGARSANRLFDSWVNQIDIEYLLRTSDDVDDKPRSLLDSAVLDDIARSVFSDGTSSASPPEYIGDALHLLLTVANLRGVPYSIPFSGSATRHGMVMHADYVHFCVSDDGRETSPGALELKWSEIGGQSAEAGMLLSAALATGAFPLALLPRTLSYRFASGKTDLYSEREWPIPGESSIPSADGKCECFRYSPIACSWGDARPDPYEFLCVDGGLMNNEPLECARRILAGSEAHNPRKGSEARRAILMVAPFAEGESIAARYQPDSQSDIVGSLLAMFSALKNQARFKPDELALAAEESVYSRFLVAPVRDGASHQIGEAAIACGSLGGFGGFLDRTFRVHDFFLGRRNCQKFLLHHFSLPEKTNPLFATWRDSDFASVYRHDGGQEAHLPIIPLVTEDLRREIPLPVWPALGEGRLDEIRSWIAKRYDHVTEQAIRGYVPSAFGRLIGRLFRNSQRGAVVDRALSAIEVALAERRLYHKP